MPIYESGMCQFCGEDSDLLLPKIGYDRVNGVIVCGFACPKCRKYLTEMEAEQRESRTSESTNRARS